MAKDRNRRYASTSDLLLDLEAIARGEPPLQARKQIDMGLLTGLGGAHGTQKELPDTEDIEAPRNLLMYVIALAAALALSVLLNIVLFLR